MGQLGSGDDGHGCVDKGLQHEWSTNEVALKLENSLAGPGTC